MYVYILHIYRYILHTSTSYWFLGCQTSLRFSMWARTILSFLCSCLTIWVQGLQSVLQSTVVLGIKSRVMVILRKHSTNTYQFLKYTILTGHPLLYWSKHLRSVMKAMWIYPRSIHLTVISNNQGWYVPYHKPSSKKR